jgi:hypothetical protein
MTELLIANTARFPHDTIDGETLLIDSETGHVLMMTGVGPLLWQRLLGGVAVESLADEVVDRFGPAAGEDCRVFLRMLAENGLAIPAPDTDMQAAPVDWPDSFAPPMLERYDDIANIITMDPIHDVDQSAGWPRRSGGS